MHVEIWSDIACPWCYVGKRRFEAALAAFEHRDEVRVTWRSFELDPAAPAARERSGAEHLAEKYGMSVEEARARQAQMAEMAAGDGLDMRADLTRGANTFDGHRLLQLAGVHGLQTEMKERLMRAYHTEGELVSDHDTLVRLAVEVGLDADEVRETLASDRFAAEVREDEQTAVALGISAVPCFVIDRRFGAPGAQPPEVLTAFLQRGWDERSPVEVGCASADGGLDGR
jgi:predicted DsbA family dithiol-disulfide isomerase